jgi:hypothetical protein
MKGMETKRAYAVPILFAVVVLVVIPLSIYVGSYLWFGNYAVQGTTPIRTYDYRWQIELFGPLGMAEKFVTGRALLLAYRPRPEELQELNRTFSVPSTDQRNPPLTPEE